jgi:CheY-like chemotaxis protein
MKKPRILLVDDEAIVRDSISEWLRNDAYEVDCASSGEEALNRIKEKQFDIAVVDLKMPGMDGIEVMKRVKQDSPNTLVIIITAYGTPENEAEAMKVGASEYLTKPFTPDKLEEAINEVYRQKTGTETITPPAPKTELVHGEPVPSEQVEVKVKGKPAKQCIWSKAGVVSYRLCTNNFRCDSCEFAQSLMDKGAQLGDSSDLIKKMLEKSGQERACRYMLSGQVTYRLCSNVYRCGQCAFNEAMEERLDAEAAKMVAKIKSMQARRSGVSP